MHSMRGADMRMHHGYDIGSFLDYIDRKHVKTPVKLEIRIKKIDKAGSQKRYMKFYLEGNDVTVMAANGANLDISDDISTKDCAIVRGYGQDMVGYAQRELWKGACKAGREDAVSEKDCIYLGKDIDPKDVGNYYRI